MKKAKVLLLSVAVMGVVGGALAFKAKKFTTDFICYTTITANRNLLKSCPLSSFDVTTTLGTPSTIAFTTVTTTTLCTEVSCPTLIKTFGPEN